MKLSKRSNENRIKITLELGVPLKTEEDFDIEVWLIEQEKMILCKILEDIDKQISTEYVSQGYKLIRTHRRRLKTISGLIEFKYRVLRKGNKNITPLLDFLNLSRGQRVSNLLRNLAAFVATEHTYRETERIISDMRAIDISHSSIRNFLIELNYGRKKRSRSSRRY